MTCGAPALAEPDPDSVLVFPMLWVWRCLSGHVTRGADATVADEVVDE